MKTLLLSIGIVFIGLTTYAQQTSTQVIVPPSHVDLQDPYSITLKPGFWAKSGSVFHARIGYAALHWDCPIITEKGFGVAHINPNSYSPSDIDTSKKLLLAYDTAGNTSRIYFANAKAGSSGSGNSSNYSIDTITSLIYVYPNPTSGSITVSWDDSVDDLINSAELVVPNGVQIPLKISTVNGKREGSISFSGNTGMYFLYVTLIDGRVVSKKIIKNY